MKSHEINKLENFISGWYIEDDTLCDDIIKYFDALPIKNRGSITTEGVYNKVKLDYKDSYDHPLEDVTLYKRYFDSLKQVIDKYIEQYPMCNIYSPASLITPINIQYYKPKGGFHAWHTERSNRIEPVTSRHLVFMTYLNDVDDDGHTEFYHQKLKVKPRKNLTLIWPTDWTFTHRGVASPTQEKYITTGWLNYLE